MATEINKTTYQGLALPDDRATLWAAESSYTQGGPTPGIPVAENDTDLVLQSSGTAAAGASLVLRTSKGGLVTGNDGARYLWKNTTDAATLWRGWDAPALITGYGSVRWTDASGDLKYATEPDVVTLSDQKILAAYATRDTSRASEYGVEVSIRSAASGAWSNVTVYTTTFATPANQERAPCLVVLPSGRVLCLFWIFDNAGGANIRAYYSDDSGATWALYSAHCLRDNVPYAASGATYKVKRLRAAYNDGQILLIAQATPNHSGNTHKDALLQWASVDLGHWFALVTEQWRTDGSDASTGEAVGAFDLSVAGGLFILATISESAAVARDVVIRRLGSAYQHSKTAATIVADAGTWGAVSTTTFTLAELALVVDETGRIYVYGLFGGDSSGLVVSSYDNGATWSMMGQGSTTGSSKWWHSGDTATHPTSLAATSQQGRIVMVSNHTAAPGNEDDSLTAIYLGGYSTVTMPGYTRHQREENRATWKTPGCPMISPPTSDGRRRAQERPRSPADICRS